MCVGWYCSGDGDGYGEVEKLYYAEKVCLISPTLGTKRKIIW